MNIKRQVKARVNRYLALAAKHHGTSPLICRIDYLVCGTDAGFAYTDQCKDIYGIVFNSVMLARAPKTFLEEIVPHEVAHIACFQIHRELDVPPHGAEWRSMMRLFGATPKACHTISTRGIPPYTEKDSAKDMLPIFQQEGLSFAQAARSVSAICNLKLESVKKLG